MRACPQCAAAEIEFNERYRVDGKTVPALFCESPRCGYVEFVRAGNSGKARQASSELHIKAARVMMKAHANAERSKKLIDRASRLSDRRRIG